jgi:hypothetical protein
MNEILDQVNPGGRPPALDQEKRRKIIALLAGGNSRRTAAGYVGCAPNTIVRTMLRDPDFAAAVNKAEQNTEIEALRRIRNAGRDHRYWRAAAWLLERRNPQDFAHRPPRAYTDQQIADLFLTVASPFVAKMPADDVHEALDRLNEIIRLSRIRPEEADKPYSPPKRPIAWDYQKTNRPERGSFGSDPSNDLSDLDDDLSSQIYVVQAAQIVAIPPVESAV